MAGFLDRLRCWGGAADASRAPDRRVRLFDAAAAKHAGYTSNELRTAKYRWLTLLPLALFNQVRWGCGVGGSWVGTGRACRGASFEGKVSAFVSQSAGELLLQRGGRRGSGISCCDGCGWCLCNGRDCFSHWLSFHACLSRSFFFFFLFLDGYPAVPRDR